MEEYYDSVTLHFNTITVENVIELVVKANPKVIMDIKSTVTVVYTAFVREKYNRKKSSSVPNFCVSPRLCKITFTLNFKLSI